MARVAVIGSCITRDLWPLRDQAPADLLYVSRTSLASLFAPPVAGFTAGEDPPAGLTRYQHRALTDDLAKRSLRRLVEHRPTHLIFDFIDERYDLLALPGGAIVTRSWELEASGYLDQPALAGARPIPRLGEACRRLWNAGLLELAVLLRASVLGEARVILHSAQWATRWRDPEGREPAFGGELEILPGRPADLAAHNRLLRRYEQAFLAALPQAEVIGASPAHVIADAGHRWGLSPFHFVPQYYDDIWRELHARGV